jgi:alginate O-acetyltransferase complex protein AlgI
MIFNSFQYALFLPIVLGIYWLLKRRDQNLLLLVSSYYFYAVWDVRFLGLMWISTATDYVVGRLLDSTDDEKRRKRIFLASLVVNLGILAFFKYFNFFIDSAVDLLQTFGLNPNRPVLNILLPVGISFYTFHGISYTFDVYRREIPASRSIIDFACFVAYFPQLVAGPIGRARIQLPQFANPRQRPGMEDVRSGLFLIVLGLFKKVAIADGLAPFVNQTFAQPGKASVAQLLVGMYGFVLQVYGDFSGYSDIARGSSRLFGIELPRNFEQPFLSRNLTELWQRWHISLTRWMRDYLFPVLGGNRPSRAPLVTFIVMLVVGLWHGAAWTFVAWGGINGAFLVVERWWILRSRRLERQRDPEPIGGAVERLPDTRVDTPAVAQAVKKRVKEAPLPPRFRWKDVLPAVYTFHVFALSAVFFRSTSFSAAGQYIKGILTWRAGGVDMNALIVLIAASLFTFGIDILQRATRDETFAIHASNPARGLIYAVLFLSIVIFSGGSSIPFFYFQF